MAGGMISNSIIFLNSHFKNANVWQAPVTAVFLLFSFSRNSEYNSFSLHLTSFEFVPTIHAVPCHLQYIHSFHHPYNILNTKPYSSDKSIRALSNPVLSVYREYRINATLKSSSGIICFGLV